jgi:hypothetical protein
MLSFAVYSSARVQQIFPPYRAELRALELCRSLCGRPGLVGIYKSNPPVVLTQRSRFPFANLRPDNFRCQSAEILISGAILDSCELLGRAAVAPAVDATLSQKLGVWWLRHNKERVFGTAHDLLKEIPQRSGTSARES